MTDNELLIKTIRKEMRRGFAQSEKEIKSLKGSIDNLTERVSKLENKFDSVETRMKELKDSMDDKLSFLQTQVTFLNHRANSANGYVPQPLSDMPEGHGVNEPRRFWRRERPYRR